MFFQGGYFYYITIGLQVLCVIHSIRTNNTRWIWLIVFVPIVGSIAYIVTQMRVGRSIKTPRIDVGAIVNPGGRIKKLEENLRFTDTFSNRMALADAYLDAGMNDKAIELYKDSLTGAFDENEHGLAQLMTAYFREEQYNEVIAIGRRIYKLPQFPRSKAHLTYAMALENSGQTEAAEKEFKAMTGRYSYYEQRYQYAMFLVRSEKFDEARKVLGDMIEEERHLSSMERRASRQWISAAKTELRKVPENSQTA